jgi:predicted RNA-binding protein with RPS1 domain
MLFFYFIYARIFNIVDGEINIVDGEINDIDSFDINDHLRKGMHILAVVIGIKKDKMQLDLSVKPSLVSTNETWWIKNRSNDKFAKLWWEQLGKNPDTLFDRKFNESEALEKYVSYNSLETTNNDNNNNATNSKNMDSGLDFSDSLMNNKKNDSTVQKMRLINHPLFVNLDYKATEEKLQNGGKGTGEVLIRPSSKGFKLFSIIILLFVA